MDQSIVNLAIQIPLVGLFIWFTLKLNADYRTDAAKRDEQWQTFISQQNELWRGFIRELVERSSSAEDMTAQRLAELGGIIKALVDDFKEHSRLTIEKKQ